MEFYENVENTVERLFKSPDERYAELIRKSNRKSVLGNVAGLVAGILTGGSYIAVSATHAAVQMSD